MVKWDHIDKTNRTASEFLKYHHKTIQKLCQPLLDNLKIDGFTYTNILPNGYGILMGNQLELLQSYISLLSTKGVLHPAELKKTPLERTHYFIWSRLSHPKLNLPLATGINIYKQDTVNYEGFTFYKLGNLDKQESLFIDNLKYLEMFGEFFKIQARKLIEMDDPKKLIWVKNSDHIASHSSQQADTTVHQNEIDRFLEMVRPNRLPIRSHLGTDVLLTKRETECMRMICDGKSTKEIGRHLNLSARTVEKYFERVRQRSGFYLKSDLMQAFRKNYNLWN